MWLAAICWMKSVIDDATNRRIPFSSEAHPVPNMQQRAITVANDLMAFFVRRVAVYSVVITSGFTFV